MDEFRKRRVQPKNRNLMAFYIVSSACGKHPTNELGWEELRFFAWILLVYLSHLNRIGVDELKGFRES